MQFQLISWSRILFLAGIVLALVLVVPTAWFPFQLLKLAAFSLLALGAVVLFVVGGGVRELIGARGFLGALLVAFLPLTYVLSYAVSTDRTVGLLGYGVEVDTLLFTIVAFLTFMLSFSLFRTQRTVRLFVSTLFIVLSVAALFQLLLIIFGSGAIPLAAFADRSVNLIGKWNDLGLVLGLLSLFALVRVELMSASRLWHIGVIIGGVLLVLVLGIINFALAWGMILAFALVVAFLKFLTERGGKQGEEGSGMPRTWLRKTPWLSLVLSIVAVVFLFFGTALNTALTTWFPVSSLEVRPSYESTLGVINEARGGSFARILVGTGPNTFGQQWLLYKPTEVNQSPFWNLDFNVGFSTLTTSLGSVGLVGVLAWLIPLLLVVAGVIRAMRSSVLSREDKTLATTLALGSVFLFVSLLLYVPSQNVILLALALSGVAFGFLWRQGQSAREENDTTLLGAYGVIGGIVVLLVLSVWSTFMVERRFLVQTFVGYGVSQLNAGEVDKALAASIRANALEQTVDANRLLVDAGSVRMQSVATNADLPVAEAQQQFASSTADTIAAAQAAISLYPKDYRPHLVLANVYAYLASLQIEGAADVARSTYLEAKELSPKNPQIPLLLSRLEFASNNPQLGEQYLSEALTLKPNYTDAILLVVQINIANNDLASAITAAEAAVQSAPGVGSLWFQLGLLYYSGGSTANAIGALEQALAIIPDYANAQYFLGLSYYAQNRAEDGIRQFEELARTNPDNAEVQVILDNMREGVDAFEGITPPAPAPEDRATAPVSE